MRNTLRRLIGAFRVELGLLCRNWVFPIALLFWGGLIWFLLSTADAMTAQGIMEDEGRRIVISLLSLVACFVSVAGAARSQRTRFDALEEAFPSGAEVQIGRWLAEVVALMTGVLLPLTLVYTKGPASSFWAGAPLFLGESLLVLAFSTALGRWLSTIRKGGRWVSLIVAAIWLACISIPGPQWPRLNLIRFMGLVISGYQELWGRHSEALLPLWFSLFYLGLTIALVGSLTWVTNRRRYRRHTAASVIASVLGLGIAIGGAAQYLSAMERRNAIYTADRAYHQTIVSEVALPGSTPERIDDYQIGVDLTDSANPRFTALLTVRNTGQSPLNQVWLTLNRNLDVVDLSLPFHRDGDFIALELKEPLAPAKTLTVQIRYHGNPQVFTSVGSGYEHPIFFADAAGVRLSTAAGWYPLAGRTWYAGYLEFGPEPAHHPGEFLLGDWRLNLLPPPSRFHLKVEGPPGITFTSNLAEAGSGEFSAQAASWVSLVGSRELRVDRVGAVTVAAPRNDMESVLRVIPEFDRAKELLTHLFPDASVRGVHVAALDNPIGIPKQAIPADGLLYVHTNRLFLRDPILGQMEFDQMLASSWILGGGETDGVAYQAAAQFAYSRYSGEAANSELFGPTVSRLQSALQQAYLSEGEGGAGRLLHRLRVDSQKVDRLPPDQVDAWLQEAMR